MEIAGYQVLKIPRSTVVYAGLDLFRTTPNYYYGTLDTALFYAFGHQMMESRGGKVIILQFAEMVIF